LIITVTITTNENTQKEAQNPGSLKVLEDSIPTLLKIRNLKQKKFFNKKNSFRISARSVRHFMA